MKISDEHYAKLEAGIRQVLTHLPNSIAEYKAAGLSDMRLRWDALRAAKIDGNSNSFICDVLYPYLNDAHIDSALRKIFGHKK